MPAGTGDDTDGPGVRYLSKDESKRRISVDSTGAVSSGRGGSSGRSRFPTAFTGVPGSIPPQSMRGMNDGGEGGTPWAATDAESFLRENLSLKDLVSLAYMFNFTEAGMLGLVERKAVVQVCCFIHRLVYFIQTVVFLVISY